MKQKWMVLAACLMCLPWAANAQKEFDNWPEGTSPREVGTLVSQRFVEVPHPNFDTNPAPPSEITYPETCAWLGALRRLVDSLAVTCSFTWVKLISTSTSGSTS